VVIVGQRVDLKRQSVADKVPVVLIYSKTGSWGSGVIVDQTSGIVLTCGHVVMLQSQGVYYIINIATSWLIEYCHTGNFGFLILV